jgi:ethanolamine ammonia-lyase large subunit
MDPSLDQQRAAALQDAKSCIYAALPASFPTTLASAVPAATRSRDREDYILHPPTGER